MAIYIDTGDNTSAKRVLRIRELADGISSNGISDASILEKLEKSDRWMDTITNKFDWAETDQKWETALEASEVRTASQINGILATTKDDLIEDYKAIIRALNRKEDIQGTAEEPTVYVTAGHEE